MRTDKPLPANIKSERGVLGRIFLCDNIDAVFEIFEKINIDMFFNHACKLIFNECEKDLKQNIKPDIFVIQERMDKEYQEFAIDIISDAVMVFELDSVIDRLKDLAARRDAILKTTPLMKNIYENEVTATDVIENIAKISESIADKHSKIHERTTSEMIKESVQQIKEASLPVNTCRVKFNNWFDDLFSIYRQQVISIAAKQGLGKTALAITLMRSQLKSGQKGIYFITESTAHEIFKRMIGQESEIPIQFLLEGFLPNTPRSTFDRLNQAIFTFDKLKDNFRIVDYSEFNCDVNNIAPIVRKFKREKGGLDFIYIDHLHDLKKPRGVFDEPTAVGENAMKIKDAARIGDCAVILLAQLLKEDNRKGTSNNDTKGIRPGLTSLRGDSRLMDMLHGALFIWDSMAIPDLSQKYLEREFYAVNKRLFKPFNEKIYYNQSSLAFCQFNNESQGRYSDNDNPGRY